MIKIGILGDIGSGKSFVANSFGYPVFNADFEVSQLYRKNKKTFKKLKKILPKYFHTFPVNKAEVSKMKLFLSKNKNKRIVILDIPLLLENNLNNKKDILLFIQSDKKEILKRLKKRDNFNHKLFNKFKKIQFPLNYKKKKSHYIIKNNFTKKSVIKNIKTILKNIL